MSDVDASVKIKIAPNGIKAIAIHGGLTQDERNSVMQDFRDGKIRTLVSTDLTSRGIDVQAVSLVLNYELPLDKYQYLHRIGRSGRYGRKGLAISLIDENEISTLKNIESFYQTIIQELPENYTEML